MFHKPRTRDEAPSAQTNRNPEHGPEHAADRELEAARGGGLEWFVVGHIVRQLRMKQGLPSLACLSRYLPGHLVHALVLYFGSPLMSFLVNSERPEKFIEYLARNE